MLGLRYLRLVPYRTVYYRDQLDPEVSHHNFAMLVLAALRHCLVVKGPSLTEKQSPFLV